MSDSERILERILKFFDMTTTRLFLQARCSETQISENMIVAAAMNPLSGAITNFLLPSRLTIPITEEMMESAARNGRRGPEIMKIFLRNSQPIETISTHVLYLASRYWCEGEEVMRMLLRDKRTGKIPERVLVTAAENRYGGEVIKAFFMERRSELLRQSRHNDYRGLLEKIAQFEKYGAEVMQLLLQVGGVVGNRHVANLMRVLLRKRTTEDLRLLTEVEAQATRAF